MIISHAGAVVGGAVAAASAASISYGHSTGGLDLRIILLLWVVIPIIFLTSPEAWKVKIDLPLVTVFFVLGPLLLLFLLLPKKKDPEKLGTDVPIVSTKVDRYA